MNIVVSSFQDTSSNKEIEALQSQVTEMRERISILRQQLDDEEANHKQTVNISLWLRSLLTKSQLII